MTAVKVPGIEFDFGGGRVYVLPPLTLGGLERLQQRITALAGGEPLDPQTIATVIDATHAALLRNYPELSRGDVAELIDLGNMGEVTLAVMDVSGLRRKAAKGEGEPQPPTPSVG